MRFGFICLISLLMVPSFVASKRESPPPPSSSPPRSNSPGSSPYPNSPPSHGDLVGYRANGLHAGIVVGSPSHPGGRVNIAPIAPASRNQPEFASVHHDRVVNAHPDDILSTGISSQRTASQAARHHELHQPLVSETTGPYPGSSNYQRAWQSSGGRRGPQRHS